MKTVENRLSDPDREKLSRIKIPAFHGNIGKHYCTFCTNVPFYANIPQEFRAYLLEKSIEGKIVAVGSPEKRFRKCEYWTFPVTLNVGKYHGLLPGMKLHLVNFDKFFGPVSLNKVEDLKSEGVIT